MTGIALERPLRTEITLISIVSISGLEDIGNYTIDCSLSRVDIGLIVSIEKKNDVSVNVGYSNLKQTSVHEEDMVVNQDIVSQ